MLTAVHDLGARDLDRRFAPLVRQAVRDLRAEGFGRVPKPPASAEAAEASGAPQPIAHRRVYMDRTHGWMDTPIYRRDDLRRGHVIDVPAIAEQRDSTILVLPDQTATVDRGGVIRIRAKT